MPVDYAEVLKGLEAEEGRLQTRLNAVRAAKPGITLLLEMQKSDSTVEPERPHIPLRGAFVGMGATKAIPIYLKDRGLLTSRQIMDGLKAEGWTSDAEDHLATVSATLSQLREKGVIEKLGEGWRVRPMVNVVSATIVSQPASSSLAAMFPTSSERPS